MEYELQQQYYNTQHKVTGTVAEINSKTTFDCSCGLTEKENGMCLELNKARNKEIFEENFSSAASASKYVFQFHTEKFSRKAALIKWIHKKIIHNYSYQECERQEEILKAIALEDDEAIIKKMLDKKPIVKQKKVIKNNWLTRLTNTLAITILNILQFILIGFLIPNNPITFLCVYWLIVQTLLKLIIQIIYDVVHK